MVNFKKSKKRFIAPLTLLSLVLLGQSLAFYDDVEQGKINNASATYVADNSID